MAYGFNLGKIEGLNFVEYPYLTVVYDGESAKFKIKNWGVGRGIVWSGNLDGADTTGSGSEAEVTIDSNGDVTLYVIGWGYGDEPSHIGETHTIEIYANINVLEPYEILMPDELNNVITSATMAHITDIVQSQGVSSVAWDWIDPLDKAGYDLFKQQVIYIADHPERRATLFGGVPAIETCFDTGTTVRLQTTKWQQSYSSYAYIIWLAVDCSANSVGISGNAYYQMITHYI